MLQYLHPSEYSGLVDEFLLQRRLQVIAIQNKFGPINGCLTKV